MRVPMKTLEYTVRFNTPAFLGNAEQSGQWRTPPFKALLRQWWRVVVAEQLNFNVGDLRKREAELFGVAADGSDSHKSQVRIRLDDWSLGKLNQAPAIGQVAMGKNQTSAAALYSGYGPIIPGPRLKANAAIQAGAEARFRIAFPEDSGIEQALALINAYGTLGGRCRNGWGSVELIGTHVDYTPGLREWKAAMQKDWPHAIGTDEKALIWQSPNQPGWDAAMKLLAQTRSDMRRAVPDKLMLAYPSTKGAMHGWTNNDRVPHSLRFKVRAVGKEFVALAVHLPCRPSDSLWNKLSSQKQQGFPATFAAAHAFLDKHPHFNRVGA
jgi:CRISPR-associated protein Cmr1